MNLTQLHKTHIDNLRDKMGLEYEYEIIPVAVEEYSIEMQCYTNVEKKVKRDGGKIHYGWSVHFHKDLMIEAERHAVWENEDDDLLCITPNPSGLNEVIFFSDDVVVDEKLQIDNIRMNITNNPLINDWIYLSNVVGDIWYGFGERRGKGVIFINPKANDIIDKLELYKGYIMFLIKGGKKEKSICYCEVGQLTKKKFIHCHSKSLRIEVDELLESIKEYKIR